MDKIELDNISGKHSAKTIALGNSNYLFFYKGVMNNMLLSFFTQFIEARISDYTKILRKINRVFIELTQNISYYSDEKIEFEDELKGVGIISLQEFSEYFLVMAGNKVKQIPGQELLKRCEHINSLDREKLKELKAINRSKTEASENRCNIGLIQTALVSSNLLEPYLITNNMGDYFYIIYVKFDK